MGGAAAPVHGNPNMDDRQERARRWRKKAQALRVAAQRAVDGIVRESFLQTAHGYEDLARQIERRGRRKPEREPPI
jgi:hypothetical protein